MDSRRRAHAPAAPARADDTSAKLVVEDGLSPSQQRRETADYLAEMILELRNLARSSQLYTVMVPLEYAYYEAFTVANKVDVPPAEIERLRALARASKDFDLPRGD